MWLKAVESLKRNHSLLEIFHTSLLLGLTSFGGPVAHLGYFKHEYVDKRRWLDDKTYADIIALCQFLPGPASSQVGMAIGMVRGGLLGSIISWLGFTLPSVIALVLFAIFYQSYMLGDMVWISSLKIVAVAVVAHAVLGLGKKLTPDLPRLTIALVAAMTMLLFASAIVQVVIIVASALLGFVAFSSKTNTHNEPFYVTITKKQGTIALIILAGLLVILPITSRIVSNDYLHMFDMFFRVGSIVFGGGHVVLPLLEQEVIPTGLLTAGEFLAGYGAAQAVPGPLFTFASYLGTMINGLTGALVATVAIFLPSFLLIIGALPFLNELRKSVRFQGMLTGVNASVVGILLAALYDPVFTSAIEHVADFGLAVILFALLYFWRLPAWLIVVVGVVLGSFTSTILL